MDAGKEDSSLKKPLVMKSLVFIVTTILCFLLFQNAFAQPASSKALGMNGSSQFVNCGSMNLSGAQVTIQGWINVTAFKTASPFITSFAGIEQPGAHCALRIGDGTVPNDRVQFILYDGFTHYKLHTAQALTANKWYHIAATYDGTLMSIYINVVLDTTLAVSITIVANNTFELGRNYDNVRILNGKLDEVSAFTTALSQTTIREWMCKRITPAHPNYAQLAGYWPLDEGSGNTTADASGNGNNGSFTGSPTWQNSGAPIGNASKYVYANSFDFGIGATGGDSVHFNSTSGSFAGAHIYRLDSVPYVTAQPAGVIEFDTTTQWGFLTLAAPAMTSNTTTTAIQ